MSGGPGPAGLAPDDRVGPAGCILASFVVLFTIGVLVAAAAGPVLGYLSLDCGSTDVAGPFLCRPGVVEALGGFAWAGWGTAVLSMVAAAVAVRRGRPSTPWMLAGWTAALATLLVVVVAGGQR